MDFEATEYSSLSHCKLFAFLLALNRLPSHTGWCLYTVFSISSVH